jgi:hypothetical protein
VPKGMKWIRCEWPGCVWEGLRGVQANTCKDHQLDRMKKRDRERYRERLRNDPEYRERENKRLREYKREKYHNNPEYRENRKIKSRLETRRCRAAKRSQKWALLAQSLTNRMKETSRERQHRKRNP